MICFGNVAARPPFNLWIASCAISYEFLFPFLNSNFAEVFWSAGINQSHEGSDGTLSRNNLIRPIMHEACSNDDHFFMLHYSWLVKYLLFSHSIVSFQKVLDHVFSHAVRLAGHLLNSVTLRRIHTKENVI